MCIYIYIYIHTPISKIKTVQKNKIQETDSVNKGINVEKIIIGLKKLKLKKRKEKERKTPQNGESPM